MTSRLARLPAGRRTKWLVLIAWLILLMVGGSLAGKLQGVTQNNADAYLPGSAEATRVIKLQDEVHKEDAILAVVSYERRSGITPADRAFAQTAVAKLAGMPHAGQVVGPLVSKDGQAMQVFVPIEGDGDVTLKAVDTLHKTVERGPPAGLDVRVTGPAGGLADLVKVFGSIDGPLLLVTLGAVILVLLLTYRSPFLWFVPLISAVSAYALSQGVVYGLARAGLTVSGQSAGILAVLVLGAGTDYALLIIARYREELHRHEDKHEAMELALRRAGPAVLASGATVTIGLLCLLIAELNSTRGLGPVGAAGIVCAIFAMTTLLPALLVALPRGVFWPVVPRYDARHADEPGALEKEHGVWARAARFVSARPRVVWVGTAILLGVLTLGLTSLRTGPVSNAGQFVGTPGSVVGERAIARHFPAGTGSPAVVIGPNVPALRDTIKRTPGVADVGEPVTGGGYAQYEATLSSAADTKAARDTVDRLRNAVHPLGAKVGGATAINVDTQRAAVHDNKVIIPLVLGVVLVILVLLLRALVAPLLLMLTVVLSFAASLGVCGLVFTHLFGFEGADSGFPLTIFIFLVALGVDYNIFLMTRVREESRRLGTRRGVLRGLTVTGGVITSAGLALAATFAALATLPLTGLVEMAFAVAFGVLLDTLIVRSLLVPALAYDIGARIWWPGRLGAAEDTGAEPRVREPIG
ncbi:MMPL family transporter [Actinoallomurus bryophytorum]|uniref:RND superfamily putative drug exporter n=1 Tax=Actinoallomurus bryophytorum TaxID=1490222 RepID=A0A543CFT0_9ACTN|nr:MMPL family transporter [Actinoallomurus bryophytorum]TQL95973.1 RND superfamily putative drug exporter [Actinoallomurus bryophytorum]